MITEVLCGTFVLCCVMKVIWGRKRPKYYIHEDVASSNRSSFHTYLNARKSADNGETIFSEPFVQLFGFNVLLNHNLNDAEMIRNFYSRYEAQGHEEMKGFWSIMAQYRDLTKQKGAGRLDANELGIMRDMSPIDEKSTKIAKLCRKLFLEFTSGSTHAKRNFDVAMNEAEILTEIVLKKSEECGGFNPYDEIMEATTNAGFLLAIGYSFNQGSAQAKEAAGLVGECLSQLVSPTNNKLLFILIPSCLRKYIPLKYWPDMCWKLGKFWDYLIDLIESYSEKFDPNGEPICLLDQMLTEVQGGNITFSDMFHTVQSMLIAAADTTAMTTAVLWTNLARWPEWQDKIYNEIEAANFQATKFDHVPIFGAFMYETFRWLPVAHRTLFHTATVEAEFGGYTFPKDTVFSFSIAAVNMNPKYFENPYKFDPNRFLENGTLKRNKNLMPFGFGRRSCPGKALAEMQVMLFTINLLRKAVVVHDPENPQKAAETIEEWNELYSTRSINEYQGFFMTLKNLNFQLKKRMV